MAKLGKEKIVTINVLAEMGETKSATARRLQVTEGTIRYHLRRTKSGQSDGRKKQSLIEQLELEDAVSRWWLSAKEGLPEDRDPNVRGLLDFLVEEYRYEGSYKSVRRYARAHFPAPKRRPFRRIETPPGAQMQTDWFEVRGVDVGDGPETLYGFLMVLSHSRKEAVIWSRQTKQLDWHRCHNEALKRLEGVAAVNRIDNLKTGISHGAGPWGVINASYRSYARTMSFHVDAHEAGRPEQKGKVERRAGAVQERLNISGLCFNGLGHLQAWSDAKLEAQAMTRICPPTGLSVEESWKAEKAFLQPLPILMPEPFDLVRDCPVHKDCTIRFDGRMYAVPFRYLGEKLEARGCSTVVQIVDRKTRQIVKEYPRHTRARILIDASCYDGEATQRVQAPRPLGRMARKLQQLAAMPVETRPLNLYAELAEVAR